MNSSTLSSNTLGHSTGQRASESQDSELTSGGSHTSKILNQMRSELQEQRQQKRLLKELHLKRVQSLRKELEYLKTTEWRYQSIDRYKEHSQISTNDLNKIIAHIENVENERPLTLQNEKACYSDGYCYKTGIITFSNEDYVLIDDCYMYDINTLTNKLEVGSKVYYLAGNKTENSEQKVYKIISVVNESWDDTKVEPSIEVEVKEENKVKTQNTNIVGKVIKRKNRNVYVNPDICIDLDKINTEFIPIVGDWLKLECVIEENSYDHILNISKIEALRSKLHVGIVTNYNPDVETGIIDRNIIFDKRACEYGYLPTIGDNVISDSIESDQGIYSWRSLTVVKIIQIIKKKTLPIMNSSQIPHNNTNNLNNDKHNIIIEVNLNFCLNIGEEQELVVLVKNEGDVVYLLHKAYFPSGTAPSQLSLISPNLDDPIDINPSTTLSCIFKCNAKFVGTSNEPFIFDFKDFIIERVFHITVKAKNISRKNHVKKTYRKTFYTLPQNEFDEGTFIPGIRPCKPPAFIKVRNGIFKVPRYFWDIVLWTLQEKKSQLESGIAIGNAIPCLLEKLSFQTYRDYFHSLLYLEEITQVLNMQHYDMDNVIMKHCGAFLVMEVLGLTEKRPSLLIGDKAIISFPWDTHQGKIKYEGYIHKITSTNIFLKFNKKFHEQYNNKECRVSFKCSLSNMQKCHNAINLAVTHLGPEFLFPTKVIAKEPQVILEETDIEQKSPCKNTKYNRSMSIPSVCLNTSNTSTYNNNPLENGEKLLSKLTIAEELRNMSCNNSKNDTLSLTNDEKMHSNSIDNNNFNKDDSFDTLQQRNQHYSVPWQNKENIELETHVSRIKKRKLIWFNQHLNYYQKEAVKNVLKGVARPLPYVIFGPPGTGKTITLCETILQIYTVLPESRILIATPSNSSANLISELLLDSNILKPGDLVRLIAHHCLDGDLIPERLLPFCATANIANKKADNEDSFTTEQKTKVNCSLEILGRHRITIGTCIALGVLYNIGFPQGHFTHVLVDEAGQATEPEIMIPLNFIHSDSGQVVLVGDPLQLGPVVQSNLASYFGFGDSFLSRLLNYFPYQRDPEGFEADYDARLVTKLILNYRSLPEIMELSNSLFYNSELQPKVSSKTSKEAKLLQSLADILPKRKDSAAAVIFHGVKGENIRDLDSPSWYNPQEATQIYIYLLNLYQLGIRPNDIGIVTPYHKQVLQIRDLLAELNIQCPKVSSVEGFQGQERDIIILSTVRSSSKYTIEDIRHTLGFIASPKRLNVAITRARTLLIILGDPDVLALDTYWRKIILYCLTRDCYTGCNFVLSHTEDDLTLCTPAP